MKKGDPRNMKILLKGSLNEIKEKLKEIEREMKKLNEYGRVLL